MILALNSCLEQLSGETATRGAIPTLKVAASSKIGGHPGDSGPEARTAFGVPAARRRTKPAGTSSQTHVFATGNEGLIGREPREQYREFHDMVRMLAERL